MEGFWLDLAAQVGPVALVLAAFFIGPGLALAFLQFRKRRSRARSRSPLTTQLLRSPGHTLREQVDEALLDVSFDLLTLATMPLAFLAIYLLQERSSPRLGHGVWIYTVGTVLLLGWLIFKLWRRSERLDTLRAGYDAELATGQLLDQLMRQGAVVFHDVPGDKFNVDHVVVSAQGLFAVETKGYTKRNTHHGREAATVVFDGERLRFPHWTTAEPVEQAQRQAKWLGRWVGSAVGEPVEAVPVIALPGWFVQRTGRGAVRVFSGGELSGLLKGGRSQRLSSEMVQRVVHQLDQRCRTVAPLLAPSEPSVAA